MKSEGVLKLFSSNLRKIRTDKGFLTRAELSRKSEIPAPILKHYEDGYRLPGAYNLTKISNTLKIEPYQLFATPLITQIAEETKYKLCQIVERLA